MRTIKIYGDKPSASYLDEITEALRDGEIIIYPTDTLYAIGCDALNNRAVERICRLKDIDPKKHPLAVCCADLSQAARYAKISNMAFDIMRRNLPGPFTFILPAASALPRVFKGRKEVGVRVPDDGVARAIAEALGNPLLTTSIELPADVAEDLSDIATIEIAERHAPGDISIMVDAGPRPLHPSAVVSLLDASDPEILREGPADLI